MEIHKCQNFRDGIIEEDFELVHQGKKKSLLVKLTKLILGDLYLTHYIFLCLIFLTKILNLTLILFNIVY